MNVILINISAKHEVGSTENELIRLLTDLFDERINGTDKVEKLKKDYGLRVTKEVESGVDDMCTYATAMENKGIEQGLEQGLKALVTSLKKYIKEFEDLYLEVTKNDGYTNVTREEVMKYYRI